MSSDILYLGLAAIMVGMPVGIAAFLAYEVKHKEVQRAPVLKAWVENRSTVIQKYLDKGQNISEIEKQIDKLLPHPYKDE